MVNKPIPVPLLPGVVTTTSFAPAVPAGVVAMMVVELTTVTLVAAEPPIVTPVAPVKFVPVIVTEIPPASGPLDGEMLVTVGATACAPKYRLKQRLSKNSFFIMSEYKWGYFLFISISRLQRGVLWFSENAF
jgi:hypothetical protein